MNNRKCPACSLVNFATDARCRRCDAPLANAKFAADVDAENKYVLPANSIDADRKPKFGTFRQRVAMTILVLIGSLVALHLSLLFTSDPITAEERQIVLRAVSVLEARGFADDAWLLRRIASFRQNDHWLNATVGHADAFAATNFPFEIVTLYPEFFTAPIDDTERAAILLHEVRHLRGGGEEDAFTHVWQLRHQLVWTEETYAGTAVWNSTIDAMHEYTPELLAAH